MRDTKKYPNIRYYLHGDEQENNPGIYYCRRCDLFTDLNHFYCFDHGEQSDYERYLLTLKTWRIVRKSSPEFYRPNNAKNCIS